MAKAKKVSTKAEKIVKSKPNQQSKKPKGKVVAVTTAEVENVNTTELANVKKAKVIAKTQKNGKSLVDSKKLTKALSELKKFINRSKEAESDKLQLFEDDNVNTVQLLFTNKTLFSTKKNLKQKLITLENKPQLETKPTVCLLVRDAVITKELLEEIEESELSELVSEIIPAAELKTTYKQYEKRRELHKKYDIFVADDGLVTSLPSLLGKIFYGSAKAPIPVRVAKEGFSIKSAVNQVNKVLNSYVYILPNDTSLSVTLGDINTLNESILEQVINHFSDFDLRAIYIKTASSPSLPLLDINAPFTDEATEEDAIVPEDSGISEYEQGLIELALPKEAEELLKKSVKISQKEKKSKDIKKNKNDWLKKKLRDEYLKNNA